MTSDYTVITIELGPYETLAELHRALSNHAETAVTVEPLRVVSISHSVVSIGGGLFASVVIMAADS